MRLRSAPVAYPLPLSETSRGNYRLDWSHTSTKPSLATQDSDRMAFLSCETRPNYTAIMNDRTAFGDAAGEEARSFSHGAMSGRRTGVMTRLRSAVHH